ncbi:uncharacterized protein [Halyomorpha halys]|uniref:uncharacterized protein isoform X2 n=1 Tax=Halyomorpha halys TaxID=286706 RepID=UPI0006D4E9AC|nr:uncharacterized protein LOC106683235 isoform X2 [Halyomorpha halys]
MMLRTIFTFTLMAMTVRCQYGSQPDIKLEEHRITLGDQIPWKKGLCKNEMQLLQPDFQAERFFSGYWYEEKSMGAFFSHLDRKCITIHSIFLDDHVNMTFSEYIPLIFSTVSQNVVVTLEDMKRPIFNVTIPFIGMTIINMPVSVLSTDYDNYALIYSCSHSPLGLDGYITEMAFVLRRKRGDKSNGLSIRAEAWKNGIKYEDFTDQDNTKCPKT